MCFFITLQYKSKNQEELTERDLNPDKLLYTMGEVAEMFDVNQSLIRFWEQRFKILKPKKNKKGNRLFTPEDIKKLDLIYFLVKEKGMTLSGAEKCLKEGGSSIERDAKIVRKLLEIKSLLIEVKEELKEERTVYHENIEKVAEVIPSVDSTNFVNDEEPTKNCPPFTPQPLFQLDTESEMNTKEEKLK